MKLLYCILSALTLSSALTLPSAPIERRGIERKHRNLKMEWSVAQLREGTHWVPEGGPSQHILLSGYVEITPDILEKVPASVRSSDLGAQAAGLLIREMEEVFKSGGLEKVEGLRIHSMNTWHNRPLGGMIVLMIETDPRIIKRVQFELLRTLIRKYYEDGRGIIWEHAVEEAFQFFSSMPPVYSHPSSDSRKPVHVSDTATLP